MAWRDKKALLHKQCKEIEESNRIGKTRDLFKKIRDIKGTFHANLGSIKDRNGRDLTEAEDIKKRWQEYPEELYKRDLRSVQLLSHVRLFANPWTVAHQASLSITNSQSLLKLMSIESVMPCNHLILCRPLLLPPSLFPSIRVFSNESVLHIRWPKVLEFQLQHQSFQ